MDSRGKDVLKSVYYQILRKQSVSRKVFKIKKEGLLPDPSPQTSERVNGWV